MAHNTPLTCKSSTRPHQTQFDLLRIDNFELSISYAQRLIDPASHHYNYETSFTEMLSVPSKEKSGYALMST